MDGQMTIWDYLERRTFQDMTEDEVVSEVSRRTGLKFKPDMILESGDTLFVAKVGKRKYDLHFSTYVDTNIRFIGVGWGSSTEGGGAPTDSIDQAVDYFLKRMEG